MGQLINQFVQALREYDSETGVGINVVTLVMIHSGGHTRFEPQGRVDPSTLPSDHRLTVGEAEGHYTIDQVDDWLNQLNRELHMDEVLLVPALINFITNHHHRSIEKYQDGKQNLRGIAADLRANTELRRRVVAAKGEEIDPAFLEWLDVMASPSHSEEVNRGIDLDVWEHLTSPILAPGNVELAASQMYSRFGYADPQGGQ